MKKNKGRLVVNQHTRNTDGGSEHDSSSPYNEWLNGNNGHEPSVANPDNLEDNNSNRLWGQGVQPELAGLIIETFMDSNGYFPALSVRQNQVLKLYTNGMAVGEIAKTLKLSHTTISTQLLRIRHRFRKLLVSLDF